MRAARKHLSYGGRYLPTDNTSFVGHTQVQHRRCAIASILVIDDDPQIPRFLSQVLEGEGHVVQQASNGWQGFHIAKMSSPDLVITDVLMPDMDGLELTVALHRQSPGTRLIVCSGSADQMEYLQVAKILGAHRTLTKPLTVAHLIDAVGAELQMAAGTKANSFITG